MGAPQRPTARGMSVMRSARLTVSHQNRILPLVWSLRVVPGREGAIFAPGARILPCPAELRGPMAGMGGIFAVGTSRIVRVI